MEFSYYKLVIISVFVIFLMNLKSKEKNTEWKKA